LFVDAAGESDGLTSQRIAPSKSSTALTPDSSLLDEGLPDIDNKFDDSHSSSASPGNLMAYVYGQFSLPTATSILFNQFTFDLDLSNGHITKAFFDVEYLRPHSTFGTANTFIGARGGSGSLNLSTLQYSIGDFNLDAEYAEDFDNLYMSFGQLGPGTTVQGSFLSPVAVGASLNGQVNLDYSPDPLSGAVYDMPSYLALSYASLQDKPHFMVTGSFADASSSIMIDNSFNFSINANDGTIVASNVDYQYYDSSNQHVIIKFEKGSGALSGSSFSVHYPEGWAQIGVSTVGGAMTADLNGALASATLGEGVQVAPTGQLNVNYATPTSLPTSLNIAAGEVIRP
jgi:hypothetical protein